jgi:hypothetical protein
LGLYWANERVERVVFENTPVEEGKISEDSEREFDEAEDKDHKEKKIRQRQELCRIYKVEVECKKISFTYQFRYKRAGR